MQRTFWIRRSCRRSQVKRKSSGPTSASDPLREPGWESLCLWISEECTLALSRCCGSKTNCLWALTDLFVHLQQESPSTILGGYSHGPRKPSSKLALHPLVPTLQKENAESNYQVFLCHTESLDRWKAATNLPFPPC